MTPRHEEAESEAHVPAPAGMGLAGRFTLGIGLSALVVAVVATILLLSGSQGLVRDAAEEARRTMAEYTGELMAAEANLPEDIRVQQRTTPNGVRILTGTENLTTADGETHPSRIYRVFQPGDSENRNPLDMFAPGAGEEAGEASILVLVLLVTGGMLLTVVVVAAIIGRRVAEPVRTMIDDVSHISHGRLEHPIHSHQAKGELAHLARALDRMVKTLVEGRETKEELDHRDREVRVLRELRHNLKPMAVEPPPEFFLETVVMDAEGAGTGDFVDALSDEAGRITLVVGSTATRGMPGALLMAMTRAYLRSAILRGLSPAEAADVTNTSLNRDLAKGLYASALMARLHPDGAKVELISAGHKAPAVRWDADAGQLKKLQPNGIALGFDEGPVFRKSLEVVELDLSAGDGLFLFSPEAFRCQNHHGKELGENGVYSLAKIAFEQGFQAAEEKLTMFLGGDAPQADLAFALLRHHAG